MGAKKQHGKKVHHKYEQQNGNVSITPDEQKHTWWWKLLVIALAASFGVIHRNHVAFMFESDRHFSHLSDLEREMTFRTEMGLYYSYFKTLIGAETMAQGLHEIMQDNVTEYGHTINTLKRFNLYPEVALAAAYRTYTWLAEQNKWQTMECWKTERGKGLAPILSCEGMGNQFYFYVNHSFFLAGTLAATLFLFGVLLSDSLFGGLLVVAAFFFNHGEATRVQWTPPLRESFGYPIFAAEMLLVSYILKYRKTEVIWSVFVAVLTVIFMLFWQFAQFALSTQVIALFVTYILDYLPLKTFKSIASGLLLGFLIAFVLLFGNEMLLTSFFLSSVISVHLLLLLRPLFDKISVRILAILIQLTLFLGGTVGLKFLIGNALNVKDDAHIFEILASKFTDYKNFHTKLYTCAVEFDFMQTETVVKLCQSLLIPAAAASLILAVIMVGRMELPYVVWRRQIASSECSEIVYNCLQLAMFTIMAVLIMRLKLFFTPHLCIVASLVASKKILYNTFALDKDIVRIGLCGLLMSCMAVKGYYNLQDQWNIMGEYSNPTQEQLFEWINTKTPKTSVFAGSMPIMANVKLSTGRPIVNHPHYEDEGIRERTKKVYSIFSRKSQEAVFDIFKDMGVNYIIFEAGWCSKGGKPGCSMPELWDTEDIENIGKPSICDAFQAKQYGPFKVAYRNSVYTVFQVLPPQK